VREAMDRSSSMPQLRKNPLRSSSIGRRP
jgi:hypothetical protein